MSEKKKKGLGRPSKCSSPLKKKSGRPKKIKESDIDLARVEEIAAMGFIDEELAIILGIAPSTYYLYLNEYPSFSEAIKKGKAQADFRVVKSLFHSAVGYEHPEDKIFLGKDDEIIKVPTIKHYPPNTAAGVYWTRNRMRKQWRNDPENKEEAEQKPKNIDYNKLSTEELEILEKLLEKAKVKE